MMKHLLAISLFCALATTSVAHAQNASEQLDSDRCSAATQTQDNENVIKYCRLLAEDNSVDAAGELRSHRSCYYAALLF